MKKAVHFGAGNIGRGFIGFLLSRSGFEVTFVDVDRELVDYLNKHGRYSVVEKYGEKETVIPVEGVKALVFEEEGEIIKNIAEADIITTSVGPKVLEVISGVIKKGLLKREKENLEPVNVIACENLIRASSHLKEYILRDSDKEEREIISKISGFPDAAVDRIVPPQERDYSKVMVEPYFEWTVEKPGFKGEILEIKGITWVEDLEPYIERKIFILNAGHAVCAYLGYLKGYRTIEESLKDPEILSTVTGAMRESSYYLSKKFAIEGLEEYIKKTLDRFKNKALKDSVERVGREPLRKLSINERLVRPAKEVADLGAKPVNLAKGIAAALLFDYPEDKEALRLKEMIENQGMDYVINYVLGLSREDADLIRLIMENYNNLLGERKS